MSLSRLRGFLFPIILAPVLSPWVSPLLGLPSVPTGLVFQENVSAKLPQSPVCFCRVQGPRPAQSPLLLSCCPVSRAAAQSPAAGASLAASHRCCPRRARVPARARAPERGPLPTWRAEQGGASSCACPPRSLTPPEPSSLQAHPLGFVFSSAQDVQNVPGTLPAQGLARGRRGGEGPR